MDASHNLERQIFNSLHDLIAALATPSFYFEMLMIGVSLALAILVSALINQRCRLRLKNKPPVHFNAAFLDKLLALLAPILCILYLSIVKPFAERYGDGGFWINALVQLTFSYIMARLVLIFIKSRLVAYFIAIVIMVLAVLDVSGFLQATTSYLNSMNFSVGQFKLSMLNLVHGIIMLVIVFWGAGVLSTTLETHLRRTSSLSYNARELTVKFVKLLIYFMAIMITLSSMGVDLTAFAVFGGALGVGIGLGLQRITANFVSGITLLLEKSIQIGDLIQLGASADGILGWVRQLNIRYTLVECFDGREILVPNDELMSSRVVNWTHSNYRARIEIKLSIAYEADPRRAMALMLEAAREHPLCMKDPKPNCYMREFADSGLAFSLIFWVPDVRDGRLVPQSDVMISILDKFKAEGISIPYPQREMRIVHTNSADEDVFMPPESQTVK